MRFYNGVKASNKSVNQREALLSSYMSNIKAAARQAENYGKQFDPEQRQAMIDKQFSKEQDDPSDEPKVDSTGLDSTGLSGLSGGSYTAY